MRFRFASAVGVAVVLLVALGACGGDEGGVGGERKEYIDFLTPQCEDAIQQTNSIGDATDPATLERVKNVWAELYQQAKSRPLPGEDFDGGQKFLAGLNNISLAASDAYEQSLLNDNTAVQRALNTEAAAKKSTSETAEGYGFESGCNELDGGGESESD